MADEKITNSPTPDDAAAAKPAKAAKAPAVEDKPLPEFMAQDCLPALAEALKQGGLPQVDLTFQQRPIAVRGYASTADCWQLQGNWQADSQAHQFNVYFFDGSLQGQRGYSASIGNRMPGTMESFRIDERKMSLALFVSGVLQRLNGQKWLDRN
ncbi:MAG: hypothetical protein RLZZ511_3559 [Cyanobacteriota bacterium]|jgi:hypothetical protein